MAVRIIHWEKEHVTNGLIYCICNFSTTKLEKLLWKVEKKKQNIGDARNTEKRCGKMRPIYEHHIDTTIRNGECDEGNNWVSADSLSVSSFSCQRIASHLHIQLGSLRSKTGLQVSKTINKSESNFTPNSLAYRSDSSFANNSCLFSFISR
jgi:hypothetical protein